MLKIILMTLAKNLVRILKNDDGNKKFIKGDLLPPINPSEIFAWWRKFCPTNFLWEEYLSGKVSPSKTKVSTP